MLLRKEKKHQKDNSSSQERNGQQKQSVTESQSFYDRPRVCCIDLSDECLQALKSHKYNCFSGTLGPIVEVPNTHEYNYHVCLPNCSFPDNLHEYDIVIVDLQNKRTVQYDNKDHIRSRVKGQAYLSLISSYPETIFDPRALSAKILEKELKPLLEKDSILIVFADEQEDITYCAAEMTPRGWQRNSPEEVRGLYDFYTYMPYKFNLSGKDTKVTVKENAEIVKLLTRHNKDATYTIAFKHPDHFDGTAVVKDENFIPLILAEPDKIVSFAQVKNNSYSFFFPHIKQKSDFLTDLFDSVLPSICPKLFPHNTQFSWKKSTEYMLPNEKDLLNEKKHLDEDYARSLEELESRIISNCQKYGFLHDLLIESGPLLVKTVENYFKWLEFEKVINVDETNPELREEDIRIENEKRQLVVEIKGIGGTSTDSECSQVSKFKYRRSKELKSFDIFALYLVNHQRYLPPEERTNPPFNDTQIQDAENDERGLLSTYDLFKLYFNITNGFISKEDAREALLQCGLVKFNPSKAIFIAKPSEIHHNGYVAIFKIDNVMLSVGMDIIINDNGFYRSNKILEIKIDNNSVESANTGEIGIKLSEKVANIVELWFKKDA